jgi:NADH-quinone oxidoreductase subunit E
MAFTFSKENLLKIEDILKKYPKEKQASAVLPLLDLAQRQNENWLSPQAIEAVAAFLDMPEIRVYEVASFYKPQQTVCLRYRK